MFGFIRNLFLIKEIDVGVGVFGVVEFFRVLGGGRE